ncbi:AAA family ATPase [Elioraea thermophila]|uniref:AAA family ATPase n=1 Tax=Elioraea thermophila TaxID=2185104 RepID=UPI000DF1CB32|nr:ATP-binding protein [Elioraea thermophila]
MDQAEQIVALGYARTALARIPRRSRRAGAIAAWLARFQDALGLAPRGARLERGEQGELFTDAKSPPDAAEWAAILRRIEARTRRARGGRSAIALRLAAVARAVGLDEAEAEILGLAARYRLHRPVERLWDMVSDAMGGAMRLSADPALISLLTGIPEAVVEQRLSPAGTLRTAGLLTVDADGELILLERLRRHLADALSIPAGADGAGEALLGRPLAATLAMEDFAHLGEAATHAAEVLAGALRARRAGVHLLLYGPPGTGKTEFAKTLAAAVGTPLYAVGETGADGHEPGRSERLAELRLAQRLLAGGSPALLLFDEAEDLFDRGLFGAAAERGSRAHVLRLLETTPVPVIWTTNALDPLGPAVIRRMTFAIELRVPDLPVRVRLWERELSRHGVAMAEDEVAALAREVAAPPSVAAAAVSAAALTGGGAAAVRRGVLAVAKAMGGGRLPMAEQDADVGFDPALANADCDLAALMDRLAAAEAPRAVSLLLSGPPGTGKSAFARALAERMGLTPLVKRASDLLSRWVGGSEQAIATAFRQAEEENRFLILDEADGLLADRRSAAHAWEVTQVNELLTWMERHPLPFACTTNLPERLDPAGLRRFLVKIRFAPLSPAQAEAAFRARFGLVPPPDLARLPPLVPADFALAARKASLFGIARDAQALLRLLEEEASARPGATAPIGFRPS